MDDVKNAELVADGSAEHSAEVQGAADVQKMELFFFFLSTPTAVQPTLKRR